MKHTILILTLITFFGARAADAGAEAQLDNFKEYCIASSFQTPPANVALFIQELVKDARSLDTLDNYSDAQLQNAAESAVNEAINAKRRDVRSEKATLHC